jgi:crotonobetainyl-CoA:carnitine CoA-transferase CaiB-like acyl-CoA transferase
VTPVLTFDEALADPQFGAREMVVDRPDGSRQYAPPFKLSPAAFVVTRDAPKHGEHTRDVLREAGYDDAAIDALLASRAVAAAS